MTRVNVLDHQLLQDFFFEILDFHPLEETSVQPDQEKGVKYVK